MSSRVRRATAAVASLAVLLAPWPAWGQAARVVVPLRASGSPVSGAAVARTAAAASSPFLAPSLGLLSGPSLQAHGAPAPLAAAAVAAARAAVPAAAAAVGLAAPGASLGKPLSSPRPAAFAPASAGRALPEFDRGAGDGLAEDVRTHAAARGFEFDSRPAAGAFGAGAARLRPASVPEPVRSAEPPVAKAPSRGRSLASSLWFILGNVALVQLGVETMSLAVPQFALGAFGYGTMAAVSAASSIALAGGSLLGSWASDRFGPERTYIGTLVARVAVTTALAGLYATGLLPAAALVGLFAADFVLHYMNYVSLDALAPRWLGDDAGRLNRFGVRRQIAIDAAGLVGPLAAGMAIAMWSFGAVFWAYPVLFAVSTAGGLLALRGRATRFVMTRANLKKTDGWRETLRTIAATPALRWSVLGYALVTVVMMALYFLAGPAFGAAAAAASGGSAAQITSVMTGLFAGGGVLGALLQLRLTKRIEGAAAGFPAGSRDARKARALLRQMGWALAAMGLATLGFWALLGTAPLAVFSVFGVSVPLYLAQLLMIPLGAAWAVPTVGLVTILQSQTSAGAKAKAAGINRFLAMLASFIFSLALGGLFSGLAGTAGFVALAAIMSAFAAATLFVGWRLARAGREAAAE
jgi:MFS family permease